MTVAMLIELHHPGPVPRGRKAAVAVAVDFTSSGCTPLSTTGEDRRGVVKISSCSAGGMSV